jgi:hypothetical protein
VTAAAFLGDLAAFLAIFAFCWLLFIAGHAAAASFGLISGVDRRTVVLAVVAAVAAGALSWFFIGGWFSGPGVHALASVTAPFAFIGFCGIYVLIGPVTVDRSITLTILTALIASETRGLSRAELQTRVPFDRIFEKRMRELEKSGTLTFVDEVKITPRGARILGLYVRLARILRVDFQ